MQASRCRNSAFQYRSTSTVRQFSGSWYFSFPYRRTSATSSISSGGTCIGSILPASAFAVWSGAPAILRISSMNWSTSASVSGTIRRIPSVLFVLSASQLARYVSSHSSTLHPPVSLHIEQSQHLRSVHSSWYRAIISPRSTSGSVGMSSMSSTSTTACPSSSRIAYRSSASASIGLIAFSFPVRLGQWHPCDRFVDVNVVTIHFPCWLVIDVL